MKIGIGIADITPPLGIEMVGYYYKRYAKGVHDRLHAKAILLDDCITKAGIISCDLCFFEEKTILAIRERISALNILPFENVIICATHTHTGPLVTQEYEPYLAEKIAEALKKASLNVFEGKLSRGMAHIEGLCFNRRYIMKDGSVVTNPGKCNPDIVKPAGPAPTEIQFIKIENIGKNEIAVLVNFALHPDTVGGDILSAGYPLYIEKEIRDRLKNISEVIFTLGTNGDINHFNVRDPSPQRGFDEAERIGRGVGEKVVSEIGNTIPLDASLIKIGRERVKLPYIKVSNEDIAKAKNVLEKPYPEGVDFTMEVVEAKKIIRAGGLTRSHPKTS